MKNKLLLWLVICVLMVALSGGNVYDSNARLIRNPYADGNARLTRKQPKESTHKRTRIGSLFCMLQRHCRMQPPFCGDYRQTWQSKPFKSTVRKEPPQKSQGEAALGARASGFTKRRGWHIIGERRGAESACRHTQHTKGTEEGGIANIIANY